MQRIYLVLALLGAIAPYAFFVPYFAESGLDLGGFFADLFVNRAAGGAFTDLLISSVVFWAFMFSRRSGPRPWLFIVINLVVGLSCALPAYLYECERNTA